MLLFQVRERDIIQNRSMFTVEENSSQTYSLNGKSPDNYISFRKVQDKTKREKTKRPLLNIL